MGKVEWSVKDMNVYGPNVKIISDDDIFARLLIPVELSLTRKWTTNWPKI